MLEISFTLPQHAFCAFCMLGRQCVSHCSCCSGGTLLHTQGAQMTSRSPC